MSATTHTPGPWAVDRNLVVIDKDENIIAAAAFIRPYEECKANARLIAAAPDLVEALHDLLGLYQREMCGFAAVSSMARARAALRKAGAP